MKINKKWTKKEIILLKKEFEKGDKNNLMKKLERNWESIYMKARRLGIKRKVRFNLEENNSQWKGGVNEDYYNRIARENLVWECSHCKSESKLEIHHKDRNRKNNKLSNLMILCSKCHGKEHKKLNGWSLKYKTCVLCGKTEYPHCSKGYCKLCYRRTFRKEKDKEYRERTKDYQKKRHKEYYQKNKEKWERYYKKTKIIKM